MRVLQWFCVVLLWLQLAVCCSATVTNVETHNSVTLSPVSADCFTAATTCREQSVSTFCCRLKIFVYNEWVMNSRGEVSPSTFKQEKMWAPCPSSTGLQLHRAAALLGSTQRLHCEWPCNASRAAHPHLKATEMKGWQQRMSAAELNVPACMGPTSTSQSSQLNFMLKTFCHSHVSECYVLSIHMFSVKRYSYITTVQKNK